MAAMSSGRPARDADHYATTLEADKLRGIVRPLRHVWLQMGHLMCTLNVTPIESKTEGRQTALRATERHPNCIRGVEKGGAA